MTRWYLAILTNIVAITISTLISIVYTQWRLRTNKINKPTKKTLKWYDYILITFFVMLSGFLAYGIIYLLSGYVPMSQISDGLILRKPN